MSTNDINPDMEFNDYAVLRDIEESKKELERLCSFSQNMEYIPGMEGFFSRLLGSIANIFTAYRNAFMQYIHLFQAVYDPNWKNIIERSLKYVDEHLPEDEQFTGTVCFRGERSTMEKNKACLISCANLLNRMEANLLSSDKSIVTREMQNVIQYLEINDCKIDIRRPSASTAGSPKYYGSIGRLGTAGYGSDPSRFLMTMRSALNDYEKLFKIFTDTHRIDAAIQKVEAEIEKKTRAAEKASNAQKIQLGEQINVLKERMIAFRSIIKAAYKMWDVTLGVHILIPLQNLCRNAGMKNDLTSWVLATKKD